MSGTQILILLAVIGVVWGSYYLYTSYKSAQRRTKDVVEAQLKGEDADALEKDECHCKWL